MRLSVRAAATEVPDRVAIAGAVTLTYREVAARVESALAAIDATGLSAGDRVSLMPQRDVGTLVWIYAALERGLGLGLLHPRASNEENAARHDFLACRASLPLPPVTTAAKQSDAIDSALPLAFVFTSGTTGRPKAAQLSRRAMIAAADASAARLGWKDDDRWLLSLPPAHVGGLSVITRCLLARKTLVLGEGADAETLARDITTHQVTLASLVPTMLYRLLATNWVPPAHLRVVLLGGAPASPSLCAKARGRGIPIAPTYGLTEACSQVATREPDTRDALDVGLPLSAIEVRLQDGVIQLRGEAMMDGYVGQAPLGNAWFSTGDLGCFDEAGRLVVLGRADDRIITGGENVDPQQVELAFAEVSGLDEVCVFGVPDDEWGMRVAIAVVSSLTEDELRRALSSVSVAAYARPRVYARVDEMPRRGIGKRDRRALAQKVAERLIAL